MIFREVNSKCHEHRYQTQNISLHLARQGKLALDMHFTHAIACVDRPWTRRGVEIKLIEFARVIVRAFLLLSEASSRGDGLHSSLGIS